MIWMDIQTGSTESLKFISEIADFEKQKTGKKYF